MKRNVMLFLLLTLLLIACQRVVGDGSEDETALAKTAQTSETVTPQAAPVAGRTVLAEGQLVAVSPALALSFQTSGRLLTLNVMPGDQVEALDVIGTLDDSTLQDAVTQAELQVAQAETGLAQARLSLDELLAWQPDETAVALAEANLAAAQTALENARAADAVAGNSLTSARIAVEQAERHLADVQEFHDNVFDPARDWEQYIDKRICHRGEGGGIPCSGPYYSDRIKAERESAPGQLQSAKENLEVARAQYDLAQGGVNDDTSVSAHAAVVGAQQAVEQATTGPKESEVDTARLQLQQAEISLEQSQFSLKLAQDALAQAQLVAPSGGTVLSVDVAVGAMVGPGTPVVTLLDGSGLEFHTTNLSERDLAQISLGQTGLVTLKAYPNEPIEAAVVQIALRAGPAVGDAITFPAMLALDDSGLGLRPGMTGRAEIRGEE